MSMVESKVYQQMAISNFGRLNGALDVLGGNSRRYHDRVHLPLLNGLVCIQPDDGNEPEIHTAELSVKDENDLIVVSLNNFWSLDGAPTKVKGIRLPRQEVVTPSNQIEFDGFCFRVVAAGFEVLHATNEGEQFMLGSVNTTVADEFAVACLIPLENRASPHYVAQ